VNRLLKKPLKSVLKITGWKPMVAVTIAVICLAVIFAQGSYASIGTGEGTGKQGSHRLLVDEADRLIEGTGKVFPKPLESYGDESGKSLYRILVNRAQAEPLNLIATLLFLGAVIHTFFTKRFTHLAHVLESRHRERHKAAAGENGPAEDPGPSALSRFFHFLGEVEAVFGIWVIPLIVVLTLSIGLKPTLNYINGVNYDEALFVMVIMSLSATRPILQLAERAMGLFARLGGNRPWAWWLSIMTVGPLLGSFITEPAAMTISALLLGRRFYRLGPSSNFAYATLGLLFVNISVGGTMTHFAAPPILMVIGAWGWNTTFMFGHFGWIAIVGILLCNGLTVAFFRKEIFALKDSGDPARSEKAKATPYWITVIHLLFMGFAVMEVHRPALLVGSFLFFLAFFEVTEDYQNPLQLRPPILVGFFLAGLVIHGSLQRWWIAPLLGSMTDAQLFLGAIGLTAFNDNAAITYLATLVPSLTDTMKYAVVAGAVTGGGLTVIANAPNPAGQAILSDYFEGGISPAGLLAGAILPTVIMALCFFLL
jgi:hypothetical protein